MKRGDWTDEQIRVLTDMWMAGGNSTQMIGDEIGKSKNSVIGKIQRLGLAFQGGRRRKTPNGTTISRPRSERQIIHRSNTPKLPKQDRPLALTVKSMIARRPPPPVTYIPPETSFFGSDAIQAIMGSGSARKCTYPIGDPRSNEFRYCAADVIDDPKKRCYCAHHFHLMYPAQLRKAG